MGWNTHIPVKHGDDFHGHELLQPRTRLGRVYAAPKLPIQIKRCSFELREIYAKCRYFSISGSVSPPPLFERLLNSSFKLEPLAKNNSVTKSRRCFLDGNMSEVQVVSIKGQFMLKCILWSI